MTKHMHMCVLIWLVSACVQAPTPGESHTSISQTGTGRPIDFGEFCAALAGQTVSDLEMRATTVGATIDGDASGVVADGGSRVLRTLTVDDCGDRGPVTLRYTLDEANGLSGYEIFVRDDTTREVVGLATDAAGRELQEVPLALAFDKYESKVTNKNSNIVTTRMGCFECHAAPISVEYQVEGAEEFWSDLKPVAMFSSLSVPETERPEVPEVVEPVVDAAPEAGGTCANLVVGDGAEPQLDEAQDLCLYSAGYFPEFVMVDGSWSCRCTMLGVP